MPRFRITRSLVLLLLPTLLAGMGAALESRAVRRQTQTEAASEVVANLAAGRAAVMVCKDGIVVATAESRVEPDTLPPMIVPLTAFRIGVLLGPVEWTFPGSGRGPLRLDAALRQGGQAAGRMKPQNIANAANDIETVALAFLDPLRNAAGQLHAQLRLPQTEQFTELLLAGYAKDYGPEAWSLRYRLEQRLLRGDFYQTTVHRPEYIQLYPPEKGQPRTLLEAHYPPEDASQPLLVDLLRNGDSRLTALRHADVKLGKVAELVEKGESQKVWLEDGVEFLRAAMQAVTPEGGRLMMATVREEKGVEWVAGQELAGPATPAEKREPSAPSLYKQPKPPR